MTEAVGGAAETGTSRYRHLGVPSEDTTRSDSSSVCAMIIALGSTTLRRGALYRHLGVPFEDTTRSDSSSGSAGAAMIKPLGVPLYDAEHWSDQLDIQGKKQLNMNVHEIMFIALTYVCKYKRHNYKSKEQCYDYVMFVVQQRQSICCFDKSDEIAKTHKISPFTNILYGKF